MTKTSGPPPILPGQSPRDVLLKQLGWLARRCENEARRTGHGYFAPVGELLAVVRVAVEETRDEMAFLNLVATFARRRADARTLARLRLAARRVPAR